MKLWFTIGFHSFTARTSPAVSSLELVICLLVSQAAVRGTVTEPKVLRLNVPAKELVL